MKNRAFRLLAVVAVVLSLASVAGMVASDTFRHGFYKVGTKVSKSINANILGGRVSERDRAVINLFFENFDDIDIGLLTIAETDTTPVDLSPRPTDRQEMAFEPLIPTKVISNANPDAKFVSANGKEIDIDSKLPPPTIIISANQSNGMHPIISVPEVVTPDDDKVLYFFEVDTVAEFNSPNFWRYPSLLPQFAVVGSSQKQKDLTSRKGLRFNAFLTGHNNSTGTDNSIQFPMRVTSMRLPSQWEDLSPDEMMKQARALTYGLSPTQSIEEVFRYVRQVYVWGDDDLDHSAFDTFRSGIGECGHINDLMGTYLELVGIRHRGVAGFNPKARSLYPGGGHSAIEVLNPASNTWIYADSYLDILDMEHSASSLHRGPFSDTKIYPIAAPLNSVIGDYLTLGKLYKYRIYYDKRRRMHLASMFRLVGKEDSYGRTWKTTTAPNYSIDELFPDELKIFVRSRYLISNSGAIRKPSEIHTPVGDVRFSPWATTSFVVSPRKLLGVVD